MELTTWNLPVLALRGLTVFPHMTLTFDVERPISIAALERAMEADQDIFLVTQREIGVTRRRKRTCTPLARSPTSRRSCGWASPLSG